MQGPLGRIPVVGVVSASCVKGGARGRAGYHLFTVSGAGPEATIEARARGLLPGMREIGDLGRLRL